MGPHKTVTELEIPQAIPSQAGFCVLSAKVFQGDQESKGRNAWENPCKATGLDVWPLLLYYFFEMVNPA